jgi:phosphoribosylamine--glycine ligase
MGDPETEVVIPRIKSDFLTFLTQPRHGTLSEQHVEVDPRAAATVVMVSKGYPEKYEKGKGDHRLAS